MKIKWGHIILIYGVLWIFVIVGVCNFVWNGLSNFQNSYDDDNNLISIKNEMASNGSKEATTNSQSSTEAVTVPVNNVEIVCDTSYKIYVEGNEVIPDIIENIEDELLSDYNELTGNARKIAVCKVAADSITDIVVKDNGGNVIEPVDNKYTGVVQMAEDSFKNALLYDFEMYLKHISGLVTLEELQSVMSVSSKAYKAVKASQQSLEWMIKAKEMTFTREELTNIWYVDDGHVICDIEIDLTKITENDRTVNETVDYRVLMENAGGYWKIYSFEVN